MKILGLVLVSLGLVQTVYAERVQTRANTPMFLSVKEVNDAGDDVWGSPSQPSQPGQNRPGNRDRRNGDDDVWGPNGWNDGGNRNSGNGNDSGIKISLQDFVMLGQKAYALVEAGKVNVEVSRQSMAVVPQGIANWTELSSWNRKPVTKTLQVELKNFYCATVASARVKISFMHGGSYKGKGAFLSNVTMIPSNVYDGTWGTSFVLSTEFREPVNVGTDEAPIASIGFDIKYTYNSWVGYISGAFDSTVNGKGELFLNEAAVHKANDCSWF